MMPDYTSAAIEWMTRARKEQEQGEPRAGVLAKICQAHLRPIGDPDGTVCGVPCCADPKCHGESLTPGGLLSTHGLETLQSHFNTFLHTGRPR